MAKKKDPVRESERRELAKQRRLEEMRRRARLARTRRIRNVAIALVLIGGVSALLVANARKGAKTTGEINRLAAAAGCSTLQSPGIEGSSHQPPYNYKTNPPTSGNHSGSPGRTGTFRQPVTDENYVHNLEHGHIGMHYKDLRGALVDELEKVVRDDPTHTFIAPRPELDATLAFTAWGNMIKCQEPTSGAVEVARRFVKQFAGKGPENVPGSPQGV